MNAKEAALPSETVAFFKVQKEACMELKIEYLPVKALKPYDKNTRKHQKLDVDNIARSIEKYGMNDAIGIWGEENIIVEGHGRLMACKKLGIKEVPCVRLDHLTDEQRREYAIAHNATAELSAWDLDILPDELAELDLSDFDFDFGLPEEKTETEVVEDEVPEVDEDAEPIAKLGNIWQLGRHRLMCGDSTDKATVEMLMDGKKADMVFTDPPFGVNVKGGKDKGNMIAGDLTQTAIPFSFEIAVQIATKEKAHIYFCGAEANIQLYQKLFDRYLHILPKHLIWVKNGFVMKQNGYHNQFEIIFHGYKIGSGGLWYGGRTEEEASDVWHISREASSNYVHPTQKPIGVPARAIKNSSPVGGSVVDLFGGSGSTLIACEQLDRTCYMMELDPKYCDVIIKRWETLTGEKAVLIND